MKSFIHLSLLVYLCSCSTKERKTHDFIIKPRDVRSERSFYGQHNFILIDSDKIYYHNKFVIHFCGTGIDFTKPSRLHLYPDTLKEVKVKQLNSFLKSLKFNHVRLVTISSPTDTIRNQAFQILTTYFKTKINLKYTVRKWTEEEEVVSMAKIKNGKLNPYKVDWKVGFGDTPPPPALAK